jgi:hypothetical protein
LEVAVSSLPSGRLNAAEAMRPSGPTSSRVTTASASSSAPAFSAWATCVIASYLAWIGQIGMQLELPQQGGRPS